MITLSPRAERHVESLLRHFDKLGRPEAQAALIAALDEAARIIESSPGVGLTSPRPYPDLARPDRVWIKSGRYWIAYRHRPSPVIVAVFHDTADIPGRI